MVFYLWRKHYIQYLSQNAAQFTMMLSIQHKPLDLSQKLHDTILKLAGMV